MQKQLSNTHTHKHRAHDSPCPFIHSSLDVLLVALAEGEQVPTPGRHLHWPLT